MAWSNGYKPTIQWIKPSNNTKHDADLLHIFWLIKGGHFLSVNKKDQTRRTHTPQPTTVSDILTWPYLTQCFKCRFTFICILAFWQLKYFINGGYHSFNTWIQKEIYHNKKTLWNLLLIVKYFSNLTNHKNELLVIHTLTEQIVCLIIKKRKK